MAVSETEEAAQPAIARIHGDGNNLAIRVDHFEAVIDPGSLFGQPHVNDPAIVAVTKSAECK